MLLFLAALPVASAVCASGCSGHGTCGILGVCLCEGNWAGRDCSFQLSLDLDGDSLSTESSMLASTDAAPQAAVLSTLAVPAVSPDTSEALPLPAASSLLSYRDQVAEDTEKEARSGPLAFAQARRAARDAWAEADRLFEAAKQENARDADERLQRALEKAKSQKEAIPGNAFAGIEVPASMPEVQKRLCSGNCNARGICLVGKCVCQDGYHGESCEHQRCKNDCSGNGGCFQGRCTCVESFGGEDCSQKVTSVLSFASKLSLGLAAENEQLEKQSHTKRVAKACALNCDGHGSCNDGVCECHDGWGGPACQDYLQPLPTALEQAGSYKAAQAQRSCRNPYCSGNGICQSGACMCMDGFSGEACEHASTAASQPLQLQLQQVTEEDRKAQVCLGGCGHGTCKAGMCECELGWQGSSCRISAEAALRGPAVTAEEAKELEAEQSLIGVPTAASWIASEASSTPFRALRAGQEPRSAALLASSATVQQDANWRRKTAGYTGSSVGATAAAAFHSLLSTSGGHGPVNGLASLLKSAIAAPMD